jgi:DNA-binding transcriptional MocR family regulator
MAALVRRWGTRAARSAAIPCQATELSRSLHSGEDLTPVKTVQSSAYAQTHTSSSVVNFGIGQPSPSLLPLDMFRDAAMKRFKRGQDPVMLQYGAAKGFIRFREEIAKLVAGA